MSRAEPRGHVGGAGCLYVVATPIGNLGDMSTRAIEVLRQVVLIAAEDTRHSAGLLAHFGIDTPMQALHEHNEREQAPRLVQRMVEEGLELALISDAGTPLVSDPGYRLVRLARAAGVSVVPVPGPSALIAALSASGLPTDRFVFEGFLPPKAAARRARLEKLLTEPRTLIFYESSHRILDSLRDMAAVLGASRHAVLARELTKQFETILDDSLEALAGRVETDADQRRGELVVLVEGWCPPAGEEVPEEALRILRILAEELPMKTAARLAARITGANRRALYQRGIGTHRKPAGQEE